MNQGKWALITGASSGIGYDLANLMAQDGLNLIVVARSQAKLEQLKSELEKTHSIQVKVLVKDLSKPKSPSEIYSELDKENISIDILVNNAGFGSYGPFHKSDLAKELNMIQVNITSLAHLSRLFIEPMVKKGEGKVLNVASSAAFQPGPGMANYFAGKAYVLHFSEALRNELMGTGVTVTCLCPGATQTEFFKNARMGDSGLASRKMDSLKVAKIGYDALKKGKTIVIPGLFYKLLTLSVRMAPRKMVAKITEWMIKNS
ncbi:MAG TPA: SDR family oxidoreductase [Spirochaetes bacterium]|nr:SDR family oxidoreductase [Spirochaetota bacterium]